VCKLSGSLLTYYLKSVQAASEWLFIVPWGLHKSLNYIAKKYNNPAIYVTENGKASIPPKTEVKQRRISNTGNIILLEIVSMNIF
jgi:beta-glucosidase/6-phospho-beta-glucosidase/beta-galactosidase